MVTKTLKNAGHGWDVGTTIRTSSKFYDVTLQGSDGGAPVEAHLSILASASPVIKELATDQANQTSGTLSIILDNLSTNIVLKLVHYMYGHEISVDGNDLQSFKDYVKILRIGVVKENRCQFCRKYITREKYVGHLEEHRFEMQRDLIIALNQSEEGMTHTCTACSETLLDGSVEEQKQFIRDHLKDCSNKINKVLKDFKVTMRSGKIVEEEPMIELIRAVNEGERADDGDNDSSDVENLGSESVGEQPSSSHIECPKCKLVLKSSKALMDHRKQQCSIEQDTNTTNSASKNYPSVADHCGVGHERLFHVLKQDSRSDLMEELFPEKYKSYKSRHRSAEPNPNVVQQSAVDVGTPVTAGTPRMPLATAETAGTPRMPLANAETASTPKMPLANAKTASAPLMTLSNPKKYPPMPLDARASGHVSRAAGTSSSKNGPKPPKLSCKDCSEVFYSAEKERRHICSNDLIPSTNTSYSQPGSSQSRSAKLGIDSRRSSSGQEIRCSECSITFSTKETKMLHTCNSILDRKTIAKDGEKRTVNSKSLLKTDSSDEEAMISLPKGTKRRNSHEAKRDPKKHQPENGGDNGVDDFAEDSRDEIPLTVSTSESRAPEASPNKTPKKIGPSSRIKRPPKNHLQILQDLSSESDDETIRTEEIDDSDIGPKIPKIVEISRADDSQKKVESWLNSNSAKAGSPPPEMDMPSTSSATMPAPRKRPMPKSAAMKKEETQKKSPQNTDTKPARPGPKSAQLKRAQKSSADSNDLPSIESKKSRHFDSSDTDEGSTQRESASSSTGQAAKKMKPPSSSAKSSEMQFPPNQTFVDLQDDDLVCDQCEKAFENSRTLAYHLRNDHPDPFK